MSNWAAIYSQADLLGYTAPEPIVVPALPSVLAPPPPGFSADTIWKEWRLMSVKVLDFSDRETGAIIIIASDVLRKFISPARHTPTRFTVRWLRANHNFISNNDYHPTEVVKSDDGIRLDYSYGTVKGYAVFKNLAGFEGRRSVQQWSESRHTIFIS